MISESDSQYFKISSGARPRKRKLPSRGSVSGISSSDPILKGRAVAHPLLGVGNRPRDVGMLLSYRYRAARSRSKGTDRSNEGARYPTAPNSVMTARAVSSRRARRESGTNAVRLL